MIAGIALSLLILVPGLFTLTAFWSDLAKRIRLDLSEAILLTLVIGVGVVGWFGNLLAELGLFSVPHLVLAVGVYSFALVRIRWKELSPPWAVVKARGRREAVLVLCLLALAGGLFMRPFEYILGGLDPGVYVNTGVNIARTGAILIKDADVRALPNDSRSLLFNEPAQPWVLGSRLVGFYLRDSSGTVEPHGFHLFPVWIAILYSLGGLSFALYTAPIFALLGVLALYCLGTRLFNPWIGLAAALLLVVNVATLWFARYPDAEILAQFLFVAGLWIFVVMLDTPNKALAVLSGFTLGLIHLTKIELFFIPVVLFVYFVWLWLRGRFRLEYWYFIVAYLVLLAQSFLHASLIATTYTIGVLSHTAPSLVNRLPALNGLLSFHPTILGTILVLLQWKLMLGAVLILGAMLFLTVAHKDRVASILTAIKQHEGLVRLFLALVLAFVLIYSYYVRPMLAGDAHVPLPLWPLQIGEGDSLVKMAWITTPVGLLLAGVGMFLMISEERRTGLFLLMGFAAVEMTMLLYSGFITPWYFWAARRDIPIFLPFAMLATGYALWMLHARASGALRWAAPGALMLAILIPQIQASLPFLPHNEYGGAIQKTEQLASLFPEDAVLLFEDSTESTRFAAPLHYLYGLTTFLVPNESLDRPEFAQLVSRWQQKGRAVYWLASLQETKVELPGQVPALQGTFPIVLPEAELSSDRLPEKVGEWVTVMDVYQLLPGTEPKRTVLAKAEINRSGQEGFFKAEGGSETDPIHWTGQEATVKLPAVRGNDLMLELEIGGGRPPVVPHGETSVYLNDTLLENLVLTNELRKYEIPIPADLQSGSQWTLRFETTTWNPLLTRISTDNRNLGMMVQSIIVEGS